MLFYDVHFVSRLVNHMHVAIPSSFWIVYLHKKMSPNFFVCPNNHKVKAFIVDHVHLTAH